MRKGGLYAIATSQARTEERGANYSDPRVLVPLAIVALFALTVLLRSERAVFIPIILSVLISYALEPVVAWLERRHLPRLVATLLVLLAVIGALGGLIYTLGDDALRLVERLPESIRQIREQLLEPRTQEGGFTDRLQRAIAALQKATVATGETVGTAAPAAAPAPSFMQGTMQLLSGAGDAVVVLFLVFFLLLSGDLYRRKLVSIAGSRFSSRRTMLLFLQDVKSRIERFLMVRLVTGVIVAVGTWVALQWLGLEHAPFWGLLAGISNAVPYLGPIVVSGALAIVGLVQFGSVTMAMYTAGLALLITSLEGWLLDPLLMGKAERMNAVAVLVGLVYWTAIWGVWGAFLAVPMLAIMKSVCDHVEMLQPVGKLIAD